MTANAASSNHLQLTRDGQLRHFLTLDGLDRELLTDILDTADSFIEVGERTIKKVPLLRGRTVVNLFLSLALVPVARLSLPPNDSLRMCLTWI